jgi:hypothetical protein
MLQPAFENTAMTSREKDTSAATPREPAEIKIPNPATSIVAKLDG